MLHASTVPRTAKAPVYFMMPTEPLFVGSYCRRQSQRAHQALNPLAVNRPRRPLSQGLRRARRYRADPRRRLCRNPAGLGRQADGPRHQSCPRGARAQACRKARQDSGTDRRAGPPAPRHIDVSTLVGLRDRALIAVMTLPSPGAVVSMRPISPLTRRPRAGFSSSE
jgi:hypothetical protein